MVELEEPMIEKPQTRAPARAATPPMPPGNGQAPAAVTPGDRRTDTHAEVEAETHVLTVERFKLWYGKRQALHGVDMKIAGGKVTALIGPSGCGKSTLIRSMNRLNDLVEGVRIEGDMRFRAQSIYDKRVDGSE